jgi:hypothetical protein
VSTFALHRRVRDDCSREERLRVWVLRIAEELRAFGKLDDLAEVHHRDAVAEELDRRKVVRDEETREAHVLLEVPQQVEDRCLHGDVERRDRLVGDKDAWTQDERACEADALPLPAGQLVRIAVAQLRAQANGVEDRGNGRVERASFRDSMQAHGLADDVADRHPRIERRIRILKDHVQLAPERAHPPAREVGHVGAVHDDAPLRRFGQAHHAIRDGRLAAAGLADETEDLATAERERHAVARVDVPAAAPEHATNGEVLYEPVDLQHGSALVHCLPFSPGWKQAT